MRISAAATEKECFKDSLTFWEMHVFSFFKLEVTRVRNNQRVWLVKLRGEVTFSFY